MESVPLAAAGDDRGKECCGRREQKGGNKNVVAEDHC